MARRFYHWWFRRWSRGATYPRAAFLVLMAALYLTFAIGESHREHDETLAWVCFGFGVLFFAQAAGFFFYRRRHQPPPKEGHWYDALG